MKRHSILNSTSIGRRGFSIMEIVVALVIIAILVLILTPTLTNRAEQARIRSAERELEHLADALERCAFDIGYLVRLYVLNDVIGGDGFSNDDQLTRGINGTRDNITGVTPPPIHTNPEKIFIDLTTQDFVANFTNIYSRFVTNETVFGWRGPYVTWKRDVNRNDWPDDPWGNDYLFFTQSGMLFPRSSTNGALGIQDDQFVLTAAPFGSQDLRFDRPTLISLGPDQLPGNGAAFPSGDGLFGDPLSDDIVRKF